MQGNWQVLNGMHVQAYTMQGWGQFCNLGTLLLLLLIFNGCASFNGALRTFCMLLTILYPYPAISSAFFVPPSCFFKR